MEEEEEEEESLLPPLASESTKGNLDIANSLYMRFIFLQAFYYDRDDIALPGFSKYFKKASDEEREHAEKLMKYQNMRGGRIVLQDIQVG